MQQEDGSGVGAKSLRALAFLILGALMTSIVVALQRASGAYVAEIAATRASEAGHVVTGLMMAEYFTKGFPPLPPLAFISDYALHFPAVVLGVWPPLYYVMEGAWVSVLGPTTPALLLLPAMLAALLMVSAGWAAGRVLGPLPGAAVSIALLAVPLLREATIVVGLDLPLAVFVLLAALAFSRFLASDGARGAVPFALLASAAILTKGTGVALLLLPPLALLLCGRLSLFRRRGFWLAYLIILILAGPWTIGTFPLVSAAFPNSFGASFIATAAQAYGADLVAGLGIALTMLALVGIIFAAMECWKRRPRTEIMGAMAAAFIACFIVLCLVPLSLEAGALLPLLAPAVMLAAFGLMRLVGLLVSGWPTIAGLVVALALLLGAMPGIIDPMSKPGNAMDEASEAMLARHSGPFSVLVVGDAQAEAAMVAAMAQQDQQLRTFVMPGSTVLAIAGRGPAAGAVLYPDASDLMAGLDRLSPTFIALDAGAASRQGAVQAVVMKTLDAFPERFERIGTYPRGDGQGEAWLYVLKPAPAPAAEVPPQVPSAPAAEQDVGPGAQDAPPAPVPQAPSNQP